MPSVVKQLLAMKKLDSDLSSIMEEDERVRKTYPEGSFQSVLGPAKRSVKEGQV